MDWAYVTQEVPWHLLPPFWRGFSELSEVQLLRRAQALVQKHGQDAEDHDGGQHQIQLEDLASVDDEVAQALPASDEFADDDAHEAEADVDLHGVQEDRDGAGQDDLGEHILFMSAQGIDELRFFRIHLQESGVDCQDASEEGHGHAGHDDRPHISAQPHDEEGGQGGFGQAV